MKVVKIETETITLGQFLKLADVIQSGGMAKWFLQEYEISINNEPENRRGRKLQNGDIVSIAGVGNFKITN